MSNSTQSPGEQAARFSLYVPLAVILLGLCTTISRPEDPAVAKGLAYLNVVLIVAGFLLGIFALFSMGRYGKHRILGRAIAGVVLNGLLLAAIVSIVAPMRSASQVRAQVIGTWKMQSDPSGKPQPITVTFNGDGSFKLVNAATGITSEIAGQWVMTPKKFIGITIDTVTGGDPSAVGTKIGLGTVQTADAQQLVIVSNKGTEAFQRVP